MLSEKESEELIKLTNWFNNTNDPECITLIREIFYSSEYLNFDYQILVKDVWSKYQYWRPISTIPLPIVTYIFTHSESVLNGFIFSLKNGVINFLHYKYYLRSLRYSRS